MTWILHTEPGSITFEESPSARVRAALGRGALATIGLSIVLLIITAPDYIGRYRAEEPVTGLFFASILGIGALLGGALALARGARRDAFTVSASDQALVLSRSVFGRARPEDALDLEWVEGVELRPGWGAKLTAKMSDGKELTLWTGVCAQAQAQELVDALGAFSRQNRLTFDARVVQG